MSRPDNTMDTPHVLDAANRFLGIDASWRQLSSTGSTNQHFRTTVANQRYILRVNAPQALAFGASRTVEAEVLDAIQGYDWSPMVVHNALDEGWCLMRDHGLSLNIERSAEEYQPFPRALIAAVEQWQTIDTASLIEKCRFNYEALFDQYREALAGHSEDSKNKTYGLLLDEMADRLQALPNVRLCLTHHDLHPGNFCLNKGQLVVLDWEYSGIGNPWFDAAALRGQCGLPEGDIAALPAFRHLSQAEWQRGLSDVLWLARKLEQLWYLMRENP